MSAPYFDLGGLTVPDRPLQPDVTLTDDNPAWTAAREAMEREANELRWWQGIWDDTVPPRGLPYPVLLKLSAELHRAWLNRAHTLHAVAVEIVNAHADAEVARG